MSIRKNHIPGRSPTAVAGELLVDVVSQFFDGAGGLAGLRKRFESEGLGHVYQSWISSHERPLPTSPEQIRRVLGDEARELAKTHAIDEAEVTEALSQQLPEKVNQMARAERTLRE